MSSGHGSSDAAVAAWAAVTLAGSYELLMVSIRSGQVPAGMAAGPGETANHWPHLHHGLPLADEPTSQLDHRSGELVTGLLLAANRDLGTTVIVVTHDQQVGQAFGRTITIRDGRVGAEGHAGQDYLLVARDGYVQIPLTCSTRCRLARWRGRYGPS